MNHDIVERYCAAVNAADTRAIVRLFAADGQLQNPVGTYTGHESIEGFYRDVVIAGQAHVDFGAVLAEGPLVMAEITGSSPLDPNAKAYAIDVFRLDTDGRIARLDIYYR